MAVSGGLASAQPPGWKYGLQEAEPAYAPESQRALDRQRWVRAVRHRYPEQLNAVELRGQGGVLPLEATDDAAAGGEPAALDPAGMPPPLDMSALEARLPRTVGDLRRVPESVGGAEEGAVVDPASLVRARYASEDQSRQVTISVVDVERGLPEASRAEIRRLLTMDFHRETADGYERTRTLQGFPAFERLHRPTGTGEVSLMVGGRVGVHVQGKGVPMTTIEAAVSGLNLSALAALGT
jgi:hypothetical protein